MHPPTALSLSLAACDSLLDEDLDPNPPVLAPPSSILVRGRRLEFAHCARCHDTPHRHGALPHQIADYGLGAIFTQILIHGRSACRVGEALHLNDVPVKAGGRFRQLFQLLLVLIRDRGAAHFEFYGCLSLHIVVVSRSSPSTVIVSATNLPSLSDDPSTFTFSPGIKIVSAISCLSRPKSPLSSLTLVFVFRTTVFLPPEPVTIIVSPERAMIIPLTSSPRVPMANINAGKSTPTSLTPITRCIAVTPFSFGTRTSMRLSGIRIRLEY